MATSKPTIQSNKSSDKRIRQNQKRRLANATIVSKIKTAEKKLSTALINKSSERKELYQKFVSYLDKAAKTGIIHQNKASRKKSRFHIRLCQSDI